MELGHSFTAGSNGNWYIFKMQWKNSRSHTNVYKSFDPDNPRSETNKLFNSIKNLHTEDIYHQKQRNPKIQTVAK